MNMNSPPRDEGSLVAHWDKGLPKTWAAGPGEARFVGSAATQIRVKAMHHWIRKGEPDKAYRAARDVFHALKYVGRGEPEQG
jgi:hypothetical protein